MILTGLGIGILLGIIMQRGRFCVTGMLRDIFLQRSWRGFTALLVVISVHGLGLALLTATGAITPEYPAFAPAAVVIGGLVFGLGIVLAGGCASGTWYRSGEGLVGSWVALALYATSAAVMKSGPLSGFTTWMKSGTTGLTTIPEALGLPAWVFAVGLAVITRSRWPATAGPTRPAPSRAPGRRPTWQRPLGLWSAGILVGLLGVIAWPLSAATGRNDGLGITTPSSNLMGFLITGAPQKLDWGVLLVLGLLAGSFLAAKATGEFRVRVPDAQTTVRAAAGGVLMGVGASLAGGCTVGNGMVQTGLFTVQGWVALVFIALGVGLGAKLWLAPVRDRPAATGAGAGSEAEGTYTTAQSLDQALPEEDREATSAGSVPAAPAGPSVGAPAAASTAFAGIAMAPGGVGVLQRLEEKEQVRDLGDGRYALDSLGAVCPFPLLQAQRVMGELSAGDRLVIDFDCTQATDAIPQWAAKDGHAVEDFRETGSASWQITLRKGGAARA
ncbi:YeeE/YedE thiosulfate transporter family protein [Rothia kristinae]|uniref:YeeE/YedE thiosulfate transporter family protein n=1 Tax=Rothia kristinae TaxID=37923 RepID=UPI0018CB4C6C|nr:YeeE/YedE family protein [Rothia kristinae]